MILTCPECATRYSVADDSVGAEGRTVRCTSCGLTWRAEREGALDLQPGAAPGPPGPPKASDDLPRAFRERLAAQKQGREVARSGLVWGGAAAGFALAVISVVLGRNDVVAAWPNSASAYAGLGLAVNSVGLVIEGQPAQVGWEHGRPTVLVSGKLRNVRNRPVKSPPLRFTLLDGHGKALSQRVFQVTNAEIPAGSSRTFTVKLQNPPESVQDVEIGFELKGAKEGGHGASGGHGGGAHAEPAHAEAGHAKPAHAETGHAGTDHAEPGHAAPAHAAAPHRSTPDAHAPTKTAGAGAPDPHAAPAHADPAHAPALRAAHGAGH